MLFGRQVILQIGDETGAGTEYPGFRVRFRVDMSSGAEPNKAVIEMYGAGDEVAALAQKEDSIVRLLAGYTVPSQIFRGNPISGGTVLAKQGPEWVLHIEAQDGQRQWKAGRISVAYSTDTTSDQVFDALADALGVARGSIRFPSDYRLSQGAVLVGNARDMMDDLCRSLGATWSIIDGALTVYPVDGDTGETAIVFSEANGNLITAKKTLEGCEIVGLLEPAMRPGRLAQVEGAQVSGLFVADAVSFEGDSGYDTPFYVSVKGKPRA